MNTSIPIFKKIKYTSSKKENLIELYNEATEDYEFWSKDYNMHFGYYIPFKTNIFKRDTMLNEMNNQVFERLQLTHKKRLIVDLGCGMGGTMKYGLRKHPLLQIIGVSISPFQVQEGNKRLKNYTGLIIEQDYCNKS